jgi:hypothetical protein|tara:strand:- start:205 stop:351 length:147 start_codon:yes stop_codon:yes gene_type:complete
VTKTNEVGVDFTVHTAPPSFARGLILLKGETKWLIQRAIAQQVAETMS